MDNCKANWALVKVTQGKTFSWVSYVKLFERYDDAIDEFYEVSKELERPKSKIVFESESLIVAKVRNDKITLEVVSVR